ncbi:MAG: shikimate kinase [Pyrinomonadaceae bacterium]|nr:shikimate kinase [Pyrinomonadaceae bacterium]
MTGKLPTIVLTGFMGAGKTTVAASLARQLNCRVVDLDALIAEREGRSVPALIREEGEARFRELETEVLRELLESREAGVIALGGGAWALELNRALIAQHECITIWLDASFALCWQRITRAQHHDRPLAAGRRETRRLYDERRPLYELASMRVDVNADRSAAKVAAEIIKTLEDEQRLVKS